MKKKLFIFIIVHLFIGNLYSQQITRNVNFEKCYIAIDNNINIRISPNINCKILGQLFENDEIFVYSDKSTNEWLYCYVPKINNFAYCYAQYFEEKYYILDVVDDIINNQHDIILKLNTKKLGISPMNLILKKIINTYSEDDCIKIVNIAYNYGCNEDSLNENTSLLLSINKGYLNLLYYLLSKDEFVNTINEYYMGFGTPLFYSIYNGNIELTELLLINGANPNVHTRYDWTMFETVDKALKKNNINNNTAIKIKNLLLKYGYDSSQDYYSEEEKVNKYLK